LYSPTIIDLLQSLQIASYNWIRLDYSASSPSKNWKSTLVGCMHCRTKVTHYYIHFISQQAISICQWLGKFFMTRYIKHKHKIKSISCRNIHTGTILLLLYIRWEHAIRANETMSVILAITRRSSDINTHIGINIL